MRCDVGAVDAVVGADGFVGVGDAPRDGAFVDLVGELVLELNDVDVLAGESGGGRGEGPRGVVGDVSSSITY